MTADVLSGNDSLLIAAAALFGLGAGAVLVLWWWVGRHARHVLALTRRRTNDLARPGVQRGWRWLLARPRPDRQWRTRQGQRRELLAAVAGAQRAVLAARQAGAPIGDLESLSRRLRATSQVLDASLALDQRASRGQAAAHEQVTEVMQAARDIQAAASLCLAAAHRPATADLLADAERELAALAAGLDRAHPRTGVDPLGRPLSVQV